uniref:Apoptosis-antagonizing transcription factor C-terminal domain-containing protein n=1 Tax=Strombidium inclinatum TaxID=197538 RepID=A0A7S3MWN6_9SPIT|mmetsp:Transcript_21669/g.33361  ORF Transcript_21669/g.33361 Transcript_21669/m.33361 type:complete len:195 (+) Transcript_21669:816-1400(+)
MTNKSFSQVSQKKKVFGRSVTDQVADIMNDEEALKAAIERVSFKHDPNQLPVGADPLAELTDKDPQVFNDNDFYKVQLSDFLTMSGQTGVDEGDDKGDDDYLHGADLSLTQKYLAKREKLKELNLQRKKEIDRRATKGRKIKYIVYDKLKNFMTPVEESTFTVIGKDAILSNMFGKKSETGEGAAIDLFAEVNA